MPDPDVLTVSELSSKLRIGRRQLYELIRRGEVPGVIRLGRTIRISTHAVDNWISGPDNGDHEETTHERGLSLDDEREVPWKPPPES